MIEAEIYGMMPRPKIVTSLKRLALSMATASSMSPTPPFWLLRRCTFAMIEDRHLNLKADAIDGEHQQRQTDLGAQLGNLPDDADFFPHGAYPSLAFSVIAISGFDGRVAVAATVRKLSHRPARAVDYFFFLSVGFCFTTGFGLGARSLRRRPR